MYEFREIHDKQTWDNFITHCGYPSTFIQSWNWGELQKKHHQAISYGIFEDNQQIGAFIAVIVNAKRGKYIYIRNGPVLDWNNFALVDATMLYLKNLAVMLKLWHVRISPLIEPGSAAAINLQNYKFPIFQMNEVEALDTWILDLTQTEEEIQQNMRKNTRYYIKKAEKDGVEIVTTKDLTYIDDFYKIYLDTNDRQQFTGYSKEYIANEFSEFARDDAAQMFLAKYEGKFIAAAIFIYYGDTCYYHYSGALTEFRKISAPYLIQWHSIQEAKRRELKKYNFWGIAPEDKPNHPWKGLEFFKTGFGGYAQRWLIARDIPVSQKYWFTNLYERYDKLKKGY